MPRLVVTFCLLFLFLGSVGCRMCPTPHDYRLPGFIERCDDYRGFNPLYRAGSVSGDERYGTQYASIENAYFLGGTGDLYSNAGNYGITTPVEAVRPGMRDTIAIPQDDPGSGFMTTPPDIRTLIDRPLGTGVEPVPDTLSPGTLPPGTLPLIPPPVRQQFPLPPPAFEDTPIESSPFSPSDEPVIPPAPFPTTLDTELPFTLEELRRLDPSVHDLQIISIEDAGVEMIVR